VELEVTVDRLVNSVMNINEFVMYVNEVCSHIQLVELEVVYHQRSVEALQRILPQLRQSIGRSVCLSVSLSLFCPVFESRGNP